MRKKMNKKVQVIDNFELSSVSFTEFGVEVDGVVLDHHFEDAPVATAKYKELGNSLVGSIAANCEYVGSSDLPPCAGVDMTQFEDDKFRLIEYDWKDNVPYMVIESVRTKQRIRLENCYPIKYSVKNQNELPKGIKIEYLPLEEENEV